MGAPFAARGFKKAIILELRLQAPVRWADLQAWLVSSLEVSRSSLALSRPSRERVEQEDF